MKLTVHIYYNFSSSEWDFCSENFSHKDNDVESTDLIFDGLRQRKAAFIRLFVANQFSFSCFHGGFLMERSKELKT